MQTEGANQSLLPLAAVTVQYGVAVTALKAAVRAKELKALGKGRTMLFERADIERWIRDTAEPRGVGGDDGDN